MSNKIFHNYKYINDTILLKDYDIKPITNENFIKCGVKFLTEYNKINKENINEVANLLAKYTNCYNN